MNPLSAWARLPLRRSPFAILLATWLVLALISALLFFLNHSSVAQAAGTLFVAPTGNDTNTCQTTVDPCATLQGAIGRAGSGDTIKVAAGTYTTTGIVAEVAHITQTLTLSGGWDAAFAAQTGVSVIDAENTLGRRGLTVEAGGNATLDAFIVERGNVAGGNGGAVAISGTLTLMNSAVISSTADLGGGLYNNGTLVMTNTTLGGNSAGVSGGGLYITATASAILESVTVSGNQLTTGDGGGVYNGGALTLHNTLVGNNTDPGNEAPDIFGAVNSSGHNLVGKTDGASGFTGTDFTGTVASPLDPLLGAFNGQVYPLLTGSQAINNADPGSCQPRDQMGTTRPQGSQCDIGAFEKVVMSFSSATYSVSETGGTATITVTLSNPAAYPVTVDYATSNGTAIAGSDYVTATGTLTFNPNVTSRTFTVTITNDTTFEGNETVTLTLSNPGSNAMIGAPNPATLTIVDDDPAPIVTFNPSAYTVNELDGSATITVTLTGATQVTATVNYATSNGTATAGSDYTTATGTLTFTPTVTSQTFTVPILDDAVFEVNETVLLTLSGATGATIGATNPATLTITPDGDPQPTVQLSAAAYSLNEDAGPAVITVTLIGASDVTTTVNYATGNGTAVAGSDYLTTTGTLTITPGVNSATFTVPITADTTYEPDEIFTVTLSSPVSATLVTPTSAVVTIVNDDPIPSVQFSANPFNGKEDTGNVPITVTLSNPSAFTITVNYTTTAGTAVPGTNYNDVSGTLTFTPGVTSRIFNVPVLHNPVDELDKTVNLTLGNPVSATLGSPNPATLVIIDVDGVPTVRFGSSTYSVNENGGPAIIDVSLSNNAGYTITVNVKSANGTASSTSDYAPVSRTLTLSPLSFGAIFTVPITDDLIYEGSETFLLTLSNPVSATLGFSNITATVTILDNETQPTIRFSNAAYSVNENGGSAIITATLSGASAFPITVNAVTSNGTGVGRATAGADYTAVNTTLTFNPGVITQTFPVTITDDTVYEGNEVLSLTLSSPVSTTITGTNPATLTIVDNESPPVIRFSASAYSVNENASPAVITVTLTGSSAVTATLTFTTSNGSATTGSDYTALNTTVTFAPGVTSQALNVPINNDALFEGNETFNLTLGAPVSATLAAPSTAVVTIFDNDPRPGCAIFNSADVPKAIPDAPAAGVNSSVVIPGLGIVITDTSVRIEKISHPSTSDLQITLIAPNNQTVTLIGSGVGGGSNMDFIHTIFLDSAPTQINGMNPFTGNFRPDSPLSPLNGSGSGGTWKLHITDTVPVDTGTLEAWGLEICGSVTAPTHYLYLPLILR